jgi:hypothetical protein
VWRARQESPKAPESAAQLRSLGATTDDSLPHETLTGVTLLPAWHTTEARFAALH